MRILAEQKGQLRIVTSVSASATDDLVQWVWKRKWMPVTFHFPGNLFCEQRWRKGWWLWGLQGKRSTVHGEKRSSPRKHRSLSKGLSQEKANQSITAQHKGSSCCPPHIVTHGGGCQSHILAFVVVVLKAGFHVCSPAWPWTFSVDEDDFEPLILHIPNAGVRDVYKHSQRTWCWGSNPGFHGVSGLPMELWHHDPFSAVGWLKHWKILSSIPACTHPVAIAHSSRSCEFTMCLSMTHRCLRDKVFLTENMVYMSFGLGKLFLLFAFSGQGLMYFRLSSNYIAKNNLKVLILLPSLPWVLS